MGLYVKKGMVGWCNAVSPIFETGHASIAIKILLKIGNTSVVESGVFVLETVSVIGLYLVPQKKGGVSIHISKLY